MPLGPLSAPTSTPRTACGALGASRGFCVRMAWAKTVILPVVAEEGLDLSDDVDAA